jgi:PII-like signaling protein
MSYQLPMFRDGKAPSTIVVPVIQDKPPIAKRAGTVLTPGAKRGIYGPGKYRKLMQHGVLDVAQRIYQHGGEKGNFIYRNKNLVSLAMPVWVQIVDQADRIEMIDHHDNQCYSLLMAIARDTGTRYDAGFGPRIGWPTPWWTLTDADGQVVYTGKPLR